MDHPSRGVAYRRVGAEPWQATSTVPPATVTESRLSGAVAVGEVRVGGRDEVDGAGEGDVAAPAGPWEPVPVWDETVGVGGVPDGVGADVDGDIAPFALGLNTPRPARSMTSQPTVEPPATTTSQSAIAALTARAWLFMDVSLGAGPGTAVQAFRRSGGPLRRRA
jgi:hypothetical protein